MTSLKDRQRAAARARLEREMAARQAHAKQRRKRQTMSAAAALAVLVVIGVVAIIVHATSGGKKHVVAGASSAAPANCVWAPNPDPSASAGTPKNPNIKKTGTPPTTGIPNTGTRDMTLTTNQGDITISLDVAKAPCAAESMTYLAGAKYFDGSTCHRLTTDGIYVLQCGDPTGSGSGGPSYTFGHENLPTDQRPNYPVGIVAMANPGNQDLNGSQFFIVWKDTPVQTDPSTGSEQSALDSAYTVIGTVTAGMDVVQKIAAGGVAAGGQSATDGKPKLPVNVKTVTVGPVKTS